MRRRRQQNLPVIPPIPASRRVVEAMADRLAQGSGTSMVLDLRGSASGAARAVEACAVRFGRELVQATPGTDQAGHDAWADVVDALGAFGAPFRPMLSLAATVLGADLRRRVRRPADDEPGPEAFAFAFCFDVLDRFARRSQPVLLHVELVDGEAADLVSRMARAWARKHSDLSAIVALAVVAPSEDGFARLEDVITVPELDLEELEEWIGPMNEGLGLVILDASARDHDRAAKVLAGWVSRGVLVRPHDEWLISSKASDALTLDLEARLFRLQFESDRRRVEVVLFRCAVLGEEFEADVVTRSFSDPAPVARLLARLAHRRGPDIFERTSPPGDLHDVTYRWTSSLLRDHVLVGQPWPQGDVAADAKALLEVVEARHGNDGSLAARELVAHLRRAAFASSPGRAGGDVRWSTWFEWHLLAARYEPPTMDLADELASAAANAFAVDAHHWDLRLAREAMRVLEDCPEPRQERMELSVRSSVSEVYFERASPWPAPEDWRELLEQALANEEWADVRERTWRRAERLANRLRALGERLRWIDRNPQRAVVLLERSVETWARVANTRPSYEQMPSGEARTWLELGRAYDGVALDTLVGRARAIRAYERCLVVAEDPSGRGDGLPSGHWTELSAQLGLITARRLAGLGTANLAQLDDLAVAIHKLEPLDESVVDLLGSVHLERGRILGEDSFGAAVARVAALWGTGLGETWHQWGNAENLYHALRALAVSYEEQERPALGVACRELAVMVTRSIEAPGDHLAEALRAAGSAHLEAGDVGRSVELFAEAVELRLAAVRSSEDPHSWRTCSGTVHWLAAALQQREAWADEVPVLYQAIDALERSLGARTAVDGYTSIFVWMLERLEKAGDRSGQPALAAQARARRAEVQDELQRERVAVAAGLSALRLANAAGATLAAAAAGTDLLGRVRHLTDIGDGGDRFEAAKFLVDLGLLHRDMGDPVAFLGSLSEAVEVLETVPDSIASDMPWQRLNSRAPVIDAALDLDPASQTTQRHLARLRDEIEQLEGSRVEQELRSARLRELARRVREFDAEGGQVLFEGVLRLFDRLEVPPDVRLREQRALTMIGLAIASSASEPARAVALLEQVHADACAPDVWDDEGMADVRESAAHWRDRIARPRGADR